MSAPASMNTREMWHTPGPWTWYGSTNCDGRYYLATEHSGRRTVMAFRRSGTQGAQPEFQVDGRMVPAAELVLFDVDPTVKGKTAAKSARSVYRQDFSIIDHPDARLIAAAPSLFKKASDLLSLLDSEVDKNGLVTILMNADQVRELRAAIAKATSTSSEEDGR